MHGLITASNLVEGVRTTMRSGGCNASRSALIASCFGAMVRCFSAVGLYLLVCIYCMTVTLQGSSL